MEDLLKTIPPSFYIEDSEEYVYFTLTTSFDGKKWTCGYISQSGHLLDRFHCEASSALKAVTGVAKKVNYHVDLFTNEPSNK